MKKIMEIPDYILKRLVDFISLEKDNYQTLAIYSKGNLTRSLLQKGFLKHLNVVAIFDKSHGQPPHVIEGISVHAPENVCSIAPDAVLICSTKYHREIREELVALIGNEKIAVIDLCEEPSGAVGENQTNYSHSGTSNLHLSHMLALQCCAEIREILNAPRQQDPLRLEKHGFRCYSQHDEDGMIAEIFRRIGDSKIATFVEFGVGDGLENNSLFLLKTGWNGLWIEGSPENSALIRARFEPYLASKRLMFEQRFITAENINSIISPHITGEIGLLSIDIDGNDYYVWDAIETVNPQVVVVEYNAKFPPPIEWSISYDPEHNWDFSDYQGASLSSLAKLGRRKGYQLVGCNLNGTNAFFVRSDLVRDKFCNGHDDAYFYHPPRYYLTEGYKMMSGHTPDPRMGTLFADGNDER